MEPHEVQEAESVRISSQFRDFDIVENYLKNKYSRFMGDYK